MKKFALIFVMVASVAIAFGQKNVRQSASNYLKSGKLDKALEAINACVLDPSTASDAKAWFIRGNIYLELVNTKDENYKKLEADPLAKSLESYRKVNEYDFKKEYKEEIFGKLSVPYKIFFDSAISNYNKKQYKEAMINFGKSAETYEVVNIYDTVCLLNAALCAGLANEKEAAKVYYLKLLKANYKSPSVYATLSDLYLKDNDSSNAFKYVRMGLKEYPNNMTLFNYEINIYLKFNIINKAMNNLKIAIKSDSLNYSLPFVLGTLYDNMANDSTKTKTQRDEAFANAEKEYRKALQLKPDYEDALLNMGALYFNIAAPIYVSARNLPLDQTEQYNKLIADANEYYKKAIPFLEKITEINPTNLQTLLSLKQAYSSLGDKEKEKLITEKINVIRKK
ncbi:MAG: hypothetical protein WCS03_17740 [Bacteroidota bacterium]